MTKIQCRRRTKELMWAGKIKKETCSVCGSLDVQCHHKDYRSPTNIEWLCLKHHLEVHGKKIRTGEKTRRILVTIPDSIAPRMKIFHKNNYSHMSFPAFLVNSTVEKMNEVEMKK